LRVGGDGVQQTGEGYALSNVPQQHAEVDVLKAQIGYGSRNIFSLPIAVATTVAGGVAAGPIGAAAAAVCVATSAAMGVRDTVGAHTAHLCKQPMEVHYQNMSNATPEGQKQAHTELSRKSWWLNKIHQAAGMLFGFENHKERTKPTVVPTPIIGEAPLVSPVTVEEPKSFWRKMLSPRFFTSVAS